MANQLFGDQGPGYFVRMILPPDSLSNVLTVRCNLDANPGQDAKQQLTIVAVHERSFHDDLFATYNDPSDSMRDQVLAP